MDELKSFLVFIELVVNRHGKQIFFAWLQEYFRDHPVLSDNSNAFDPLDLMNSASVCSKLKCNRHHLSRLVREGKIRASRHGKAYRFQRKDVEAYIKREFS